MIQRPPEPEHLNAEFALPIIQGLGNLHDAVLLVDPSGQIVWASERLGTFFGGAEKLRGERWTKLLGDPAQCRDLVEGFRANGRVSRADVSLTGSEGEVISARVSATRLGTDPATSPFVAILRLGDTAVHRKFEATVEAARSVLDASPDAVVVVDRSRFITYANPAIEQVIGYRPDEVMDQPLALFVQSGDDLERLVSALEGEGPVRSYDFRVRRRDGSAHCVSVSAGLLPGEDGEIGGAVAYLRDVSEQRRQEDNLSRKNAELEHYVHAVSHDLRSPLVSMLGFARLLRDDYGARLDEKGRHFLERVEQAGRTMETLIHDLLELSRIGQAGERTAPTSPRSVLLQIGAELKPRLDAENIALVLPDDVPMLEFDETRLYQLFSNLIGNAVDHMGAMPGAQVEVELREAHDHHLIVVRDNGRGISSEHHERIFEIFQSLPPTDGGRRGTGIGLAVVRKIAESRGGRAWVESAPDCGCAFKVRVPRARA